MKKTEIVWSGYKSPNNIWGIIIYYDDSDELNNFSRFSKLYNKDMPMEFNYSTFWCKSERAILFSKPERCRWYSAMKLHDLIKKKYEYSISSLPDYFSKKVHDEYLQYLVIRSLKYDFID